MATGKYAHLLKPLKIADRPGQEQIFKNTGNADINRWLNGGDHLDGLELNFSWGFYTGLGTGIRAWIRMCILIPNAWCLSAWIPTGRSIWAPNSSICLGKELEIHTFDKPSVVIAPGGYLHCPSVTLDVTSPVGISLLYHLAGRRSYYPLDGRGNPGRGHPAHDGYRCRPGVEAAEMNSSSREEAHSHRG